MGLKRHAYICGHLCLAVYTSIQELKQALNRWVEMLGPDVQKNRVQTFKPFEFLRTMGDDLHDGIVKLRAVFSVTYSDNLPELRESEGDGESTF